MNILNYVYDVIKNDELIKQNIGNRIYFYTTSENADTSKPFVVLSPINDVPSTYNSDKYLSETYLIQVDVETYKDQLTIDITKRIRYLLMQHNLYQTSTQLDDYFKETKRYVKSRRYQGIPKNQYYKGVHIE